MAYLRRKRIEINKYFTHESGSAVYPSTNPADSPFDTFICRICGEKFTLQMYGYMQRDEESFDEKASRVLLEHVNKCHMEVSDEEIAPGLHRNAGYFRDPSIEELRKRVSIEHGTICQCGHVFIEWNIFPGRERTREEYETVGRGYFQKQVFECWQAGHFDIPIYEEI
jgi:hypothetical protein